MSAAFHAAPPLGEWINDPNGLAYVDGRYRLFVQHRADAPEFVVTNWARLSSDDLLHWEWDGPVLPADARGFAYSGSLSIGERGRLLAWHTRHRPGHTPRERQYCAISHDAGRRWQHHSGPIGPRGRDARDPFVFDHQGQLHMLLARPCAWDDPDGQSRLTLAQNSERWHPPITLDLAIPSGVMCEVPSLTPLGSRWLLLASFINPARTECFTGYWLGQLQAGRFIADAPALQRLDHGPDCYAAIPNLAAGWPGTPTLVAWASSWATARRLSLAGGGRGGCITVPRHIALAGTRISLTPLPAAPARTLRWRTGGRLSVTSDAAAVSVTFSPGRIAITRSGTDPVWTWASDTADDRITSSASLCHDAGLIELFAGGASATIMLPGHNHHLQWTSDAE